MIQKIKDIVPGLAISVIVALISIFLGGFIPKVGAATIAIFLGMLIGNLPFKQKAFQKGYKFAESDLLSYSIVFLGGTISISTLMDLGINGILFIVIQMTITIIGAIFIGKKLGFNQNFRFLMASGNAVCGSSAIAATAPVIEADDNEKGIAVTIVNVTGIFLMFIIPLVTKLLYGHETLQTSAMTGGILQSIGQVVASGAMVGEEVKDLAMIFKIVRVIFLVVVVLVFGHLKHKSNEQIIKTEATQIEKAKVKVPWYVIGFFITCILYTLHFIPESLSIALKFLSNKFEIIALAAIGLKVNIKDLIKQGKAVSLYGLFVGLLQLIAATLLIALLL